jgi:hypothetical protein
MSDSDAFDWLPELLQFTGDWSAYVEQVYDAFRSDLLRSRATFRGRRVSVRADPRDQGKEAGFWHATSTGKDEMERTPDLRRCERVRWIRPIIECADAEAIRRWETKRGSDRRVLLALPDFSYVVILADRKTYVLFITAFCVGRQHRRDKLKKEWESWTEAQKG